MAVASAWVVVEGVTMAVVEQAVEEEGQDLHQCL